jgi:drug/metabolite transporter (DMT)-like permease
MSGWLPLALTGPVLWAMSTHIDKYLVDRYFANSDTAVLMVFTALLSAVLLIPIGIFAHGVFDVNLRDISVLALAGAMFMGAMLFYLRAIQGDEASVVATLFQANTLFTFVFAYLFLGEKLELRQLAGAALIIFGALLISFEAGFTKGWRVRLVVLMLACTAVLAGSTIVFKVFVVRDDFWRTTFWMWVGEAIFGIVILAIPHYRKQFVALLKKNIGAVLGVNGANELINLGGTLGTRLALTMAPAALVSVVSSTTPLFVFLIGTALSLFAPRWSKEDLSRHALAQKAIASLIMAAGVALCADAQTR